jgi:putative ABC transport system ATP-binding protein
MIKAVNVKKQYKLGETVVHALRGVSLEIKPKDFIVMVGPSGSGKSTLLHMLGALDTPTSGKITIDGEDISNYDEWSLAMLRRKKMGFIFQTFNLIPSLTARENVVIPTEPTPLDKEEALDRAEKLLTEVGLSHRIHHKPDELSGGERQRVSIARSLINNPEIVYADEPTGNLDSQTGDKIVDIMKKLNKREKKTFVIVTHDETLLDFADKKFALRDGLLEKITRNHKARKFVD